MPAVEQRVESAAPRGDRGVAWMLAALTVFALAVRLWHIDAFLPHRHEPDGDMVTQAEIIRYGDPNPGENPHWASYPNAIARLASLFPLEPGTPPQTLEEHLAAASRPHLVVRVIVAVLSVLLIPAAYGLARLFFSPRWSLVAAGLVATSLMLLNGSQQARPHAASAGLTVLAVLAAVRMRRDPRPVNYALASGAAALAFGILQFGAFAWPALLAAHVLRERTPRRSALPGIAIGVAALAASILVFHGYVFDPKAGGESPFRWTENGIYFGTHLVVLHMGTHGMYVLAHGLWSFDPVLFCLTAAGLAWLPFAAWRARGRAPAGLWVDVLVVLAHVVPFVFGAGLFNRAYPRFLVPLLPHCACLGVLVLSSLSRVAQRLGARARIAGVPVASAALALLALALPTFLTLKSAWLYAQPDSVTCFADWVRSTPERASARYFVSKSWDVPLPRTELESPPFDMSEYRFHAYPWWRYQRRHGADLRTLDTYDLRWFELAGEPDPLAPFAGQIPPDGRAFALLELQKGGFQSEDNPLRRVLAQRGELVAHFGPYEDGDPHSVRRHDPAYGHKLTYDHSGTVGDERFFDWPPTYAGRILEARRFGPILELYRIPGPDAGAQGKGD